MKQLFRVRFKMSLAAVLTLLVAAIAGTNLLNRQHYRDLGHSFDSLYKDRLLAANYLYGISYHLNEKHNLSACSAQALQQQQVQQHDNAIARLRSQYENTTLTTTEAAGWQQLKKLLDRYSTLEQQAPNAGMAPATELEMVYRQSLESLMALQQLQAAEGKVLQKSGKNILLNTTAIGTAEISLLFVLGLIAVAISGMTEQQLFDPKQQRSWN